MINVVVVGINGRMGRLVAAEIAAATDLNLAGAVSRNALGAVPDHPHISTTSDLSEVVDLADVIIDFSTPAGTVRSLACAIDTRTPFVTGVTGLSEETYKLLTDASQSIPIFVASNFSLGISALQSILPILVRGLPDADIELTEMHHRHKRDSPSGTAVSLLATIESARTDDTIRVHGRLGSAVRGASEIGVHSIRGGGNPGEHTVTLALDGEEIRITHRALDRSCYAQGAIAACKWLVEQPPGRYGMSALPP